MCQKTRSDTRRFRAHKRLTIVCVLDHKLDISWLGEEFTMRGKRVGVEKCIIPHDRKTLSTHTATPDPYEVETLAQRFSNESGRG